MEKLNLDSIGQKAKEVANSVRKGVILTTAAVGLAAATSQDVSAQTSHKARTEKSQEKHIKVGNYTFDIKQKAIEGEWGNKSIGDEIFFDGQQLDLSYGSWSDVVAFHVKSITQNPDGTILVDYKLMGVYHLQATFKHEGHGFTRTAVEQLEDFSRPIK